MYPRSALVASVGVNVRAVTDADADAPLVSGGHSVWLSAFAVKTASEVVAGLPTG
jgi:hypothetical protein